MKIERLRVDVGSNGNNCPALYSTDQGDFYVVQGKKLDDATRAQLLQLGVDEDAILVPVNVIAGI